MEYNAALKARGSLTVWLDTDMQWCAPATGTRAPVRGQLFDFAPAIDFFLKAHLFGDIFARDNLDWRSRELATVAALSAMSGIESKLLSHVRTSMNTVLKQFGEELTACGNAKAGKRLATALDKRLSQGTQP